jgi:phosphopantetheinyl transferase
MVIAVKFLECDNEKTAQHTKSRELLCGMLKDYLGINNAGIKTNKNGKPYLENAVFYVSHSKTLVACAVVTPKAEKIDLQLEGNPTEIGLDIEVFVKDDERYRKIAKRYFSKDENEFLNGAEDYSLEFLKLWTKKEAFVKCTSEGLKDIRKPLPDGIITKTLEINGKTVILSICTKQKSRSMTCFLL